MAQGDPEPLKIQLGYSCFTSAPARRKCLQTWKTGTVESCVRHNVDTSREHISKTKYDQDFATAARTVVRGSQREINMFAEQSQFHDKHG